MSLVAPYDLDPSGGMAVVADGPEVFATSAVNDVPIWKQFTEGVQVGICVLGAEVATVDTDGWVIYWRLIDGARVRETKLERPTRGIARGRNKGELVIVHDDGVSLLSAAGDPSFMEVADARAAAFGKATLLIATTAHVEVWDAATGEQRGVVELPDEPTAVGWSAVAGFVVAAGSQLHIVEKTTRQAEPDLDAPPDAPPPPPLEVWEATGSLTVGGPTNHLAISGDGVLAAATAGPTQVALFELVNRTSVGQLTADIEVTGLAFGPQAMVGLGFDDCRASRVDLFTGAIGRTQPGLGRTPSIWNVQAQVNDGAIRGARAAAQAGDQAIASWTRPTSLLEPDPTTGKRSPWAYVAIAVVAMALSCGCCCSCSGVATVIW